MKILRNFVSALLGGIAIGIGSAAYLVLKDEFPFAAALVFSAGFLAVAVFELGLFTDKSGSVLKKGRIEHNLSKLLITLLGNWAGSMLCGLAFNSKVYDIATGAIQAKVYGSYLELFVDSVFCGMLIFIAMHGYRKAGNGFTGCTILMGAVSAMALLGTDYAPFNAFITTAGINTFSTYSKFAAQIMAVFVLSAIGNILGAVIFSSLYKFKDGSDRHDGNSHQAKHHSHH